jgi:hypothetical protein
MQHRKYAGSGGVVAAERTHQWPRGLGLIGICSVLLGAWGAIVPYLGPSFGYQEDGAGSWQWSGMHFWLYLLPGVVALLTGLYVMRLAGRGGMLARASMFPAGLALLAAGAWFVVGPWAWPVVSSGSVFTHPGSPLARFVTLVGFNLGTGVLLAYFGGWVVKAGMGERLVTRRVTKQPVAEPVAEGPAAPGGTREYMAPAPSLPGEAEIAANERQTAVRSDVPAHEEPVAGERTAAGDRA